MKESEVKMMVKLLTHPADVEITRFLGRRTIPLHSFIFIGNLLIALRYIKRILVLLAEMEYLTAAPQDHSDAACKLLSLPDPILSEILKFLDRCALCAVALTSRTLFNLAGTQSHIGKC